MKISIVTPSYNQGRFIEETILSVKRQGYAPIEHIVMDGGSTDGTVEILRRYEHLIWFSEKDQGQTHAINKGLKLATGDVVTWLNSDDTYLDEALSTVASTFERFPEVDVVYGDYVITDESGNPLIHKKEIDFDWDILLCGLNYLGQPNVFFRRRVIEAVGYLDESLHYLMDYEYWFRLARYGFAFKHIRTFVATCRWHAEAKTVSQSPKIRREFKTIQDKYWNRGRFENRFANLFYRKMLNVQARAVRQWRKICLRHDCDIVPASFYLSWWKHRMGTSRKR